MIRDKHVLLRSLYDDPHAWPVRMALVEEFVKSGEIDRAKSLIRESPDGCEMPPEYPFRIHTLMTKGAEGLGLLDPLPGFEDLPEAEVLPAETEKPPFPEPVPAAESKPIATDAPTLEEMEAIDRNKDEDSEKSNQPSEKHHPFQDGDPLFEFEKKVGEISDDGALVLPDSELSGGSAALVENRTIRRKGGPKPAAPNIDQEIAAIKWENYTGVLNLTEGRTPDPVSKPSRFGDRISAMSLALVVHALVAVVISLVVINTPRPNPPVLVITMPDENDSDDLIVHKLTKPAEIEPSAAAMQAVNVVTSVQMSSFALPEVEDTQMLDVTAMVDGAATMGAGMRLSLDTHLQSDVNFFGISSGGKRIVFVIDATKEMLVDEKGGMFAYDKVKNEIGAMLMNLNRGTKFNILIYSGSKVRAFRENLVAGLPSNIRLAKEWMEPLNSDYDNLGLPNDFGFPIEVTDFEGLPIAARNVAHYTKCIQKSMEWQAAAVFCISSGYERMRRTHSAALLKKRRENPGEAGTPGKLDPDDKERYLRDKAKWDKAVEKTKEWLQKENEARKEKGVSPKVVLNFNDLVEQITGQTPPRGQARIGATKGTPSSVELPELKPVGVEDIDLQLRRLVIENYKKKNKNIPSVHMVIFLGEDEDFKDTDKEHFHRIVKLNNGKMKMLRGLAALDDVTGK